MNQEKLKICKEILNTCIEMESRDINQGTSGNLSMRYKGGFQSESIRKIFSSVLKVSIRKSNRIEAGATGAAMIGAMSLGVYKDWNSCMNEWIIPLLGEIEKHNEELSIIYDKVYKTYLDSRNKIMPLWEKIDSKGLNNNIH